MELMIAAGKAIPILQLEHGAAIVRVYIGSFMTYLDMTGLFCFVMQKSKVMCCFALVLIPLVYCIVVVCRVFNIYNGSRASNFAMPFKLLDFARIES